MSQLQQEDEEEDADIFSFAGRAQGGQTKLAFGSKTTTTGKKQASAKSSVVKSKTSKGKGKGKQVVVDSEEDSDEDSSHTLDDDNRVMDIDELDDEATPLPPSTTFGNRGRSASRGAAATSKGGAGASRKIPTSTIMIDDSGSDSDSGLTFKVSPHAFRSAFPTFSVATAVAERTRLCRFFRTGIRREEGGCDCCSQKAVTARAVLVPTV